MDAFYINLQAEAHKHKLAETEKEHNSANLPGIVLLILVNKNA